MTAMNQQHTPEPWNWHAQGEANDYCLLTSNGRWVISFRQNGEMLDAEMRENARRIVACVNACAGLTTAELELSAALGERLQAKIVGSKYKQQRNVLLDALVGMVEAHLLEDYSNSGHYLDLCGDAWMKARDVIHEVDPDRSIRESIASAKGEITPVDQCAECRKNCRPAPSLCARCEAATPAFTEAVNNFVKGGAA